MTITIAIINKLQNIDVVIHMLIFYMEKDWGAMWSRLFYPSFFFFFVRFFILWSRGRDWACPWRWGATRGRRSRRRRSPAPTRRRRPPWSGTRGGGGGGPISPPARSKGAPSATPPAPGGPTGGRTRAALPRLLLRRRPQRPSLSSPPSWTGSRRHCIATAHSENGDVIYRKRWRDATC